MRADLAAARDVGIERSHQVHDLPEIHVRVSKHDVYRVRCERGAEHVGSLLAEVSAAPSSYGVNLKSLVVYLLIYLHVPVRRCAQLIANLCGGVSLPKGFVHGMLTRCASAVREVVEMIRTLIALAYVVGFDETTLRAGPPGRRSMCYRPRPTRPPFTTWRRDLDSFARPASCLTSPGWMCSRPLPANYFHPR